ncbi:type IV secretion system protein [Sodalis endosymbiont of Spalangia cameroni]|uniref:virB8 family protein n=1 Tax=Sodalis praecaptivus TaxID=1239307 RepID=UPI0031F97528
MSEVERVARTAKNFEQHMLERDERDRKAGFVFGGICLGIAMLAVIAVVIMLPLKQTETALYVTDGITGRTERVTLVNRKTFNDNEVMNKFWVAEYIKRREGYNYFSLQNDYDVTQEFNSVDVNNAYLDIFSGATSPDKVYQNAQKLVLITIVSDFITDAKAPDKVATVRFKKTIRDVKTRAETVEFWVARLTFRYVPEKELTESQREINPLGFIVTTYTTEREQGVNG